MTSCADLLSSWDPMFANSIDPTRPRRSEAVLEVPGGHLRKQSRVLELGCGPGPFVEQLLSRFRLSNIIALDTDPVLLEVGRVALRRFRAREDWVLADVRTKEWCSALPVGQFDGVVSSPALHWLKLDEIRRLYRDVGGHLRAGGCMINADFLPRAGPAPRGRGRGITKGTIRNIESPARRLRSFKKEWGRWWEGAQANSSLREVFEERRIRLPGVIPPRRTSGPERAVPLEKHHRAM
jgi:SAM-dependent methyltransferase